MGYSPANIKNYIKKIDDRTVGISNLPLEFQGSTVTLDYDDVGVYTGPFVVKCFLTSEFLIYFNLDLRHLVNPWEGFSHLLFHEQRDPRLNEISFEYRYPDNSADLHKATIELESIDGLLRSIIMTIPEDDIDSALDIAHKTFIGILDVICFRKRIPVQIQRIEVLTNTGRMQRSFTTIPYMAAELDVDDIITVNDIPQVLRPCLTLYREAINTCNPYYRLLCFYRIGERLREIQRDNVVRLKGDPSFKRRAITIPDNDPTRFFFPKYIGKSLNNFLNNHVRQEYRNNIAHFSLGKDSIDANGNMKLPPADNKINTVSEATNTVLIEAINIAIKEEISIMRKYNLA